MEKKKVPVILVCGFLGAGKTTLLRRLLMEAEGYRIAVVRNEYATEQTEFEVPLLLDAIDDMTILEFPNTCVCCSAKSAFIGAIHKLVERESNTRPFNLVVVELSGLTDPLAVCDEFISSMDAEEDLIELRKVVAIIDASAKNREEPWFTRFIVGTDLIVMNKVEMVSPSSLAALESEIKSLNPASRIIRTNYCHEPTAKGLISLAREYVNLPSSSSVLNCTPHHEVQRAFIEEPIVVDAANISELEIAIGKWLWDSTPNSIWRAKGLLKARDNKWLELQLCAESVSITEITDERTIISGDKSRILIIGPQPDAPELTRVLQAFHVDAAKDSSAADPGGSTNLVLL